MDAVNRDMSVVVVAVVAVLFGLATLFSGGGTLFGGAAQRASAGAYVPFVLWFNFVVGFAYVATGIGLWLGRSWAAPLAAAIAASTALVFAALGMHVMLGGAYEGRTVAAMALRLGVWSGIAWFSWRRVAGSARPG